MNLTIKPITDRRVRCEHYAQIAKPICNLAPQVTVLLHEDDFAETELDLCYQHATEFAMKAMDKMTPLKGEVRR